MSAPPTDEGPASEPVYPVHPFRHDTTRTPDGDIWNASLVLGEYLKEKHLRDGFLTGKRCLELGAGLGNLTKIVAECGGEVVATEGDGSGGGGLTDTSSGAVDGATEKLTRRLADVPNAKALLLDWGLSGWTHSEAGVKAAGPYDVVLLAELYGVIDLLEILFETVLKLCEANPTNTTGGPLELFSIFKNRPFSMMFISYIIDSKVFEVEQIFEFDPLGIEQTPGDELHMHRFRFIGDASNPNMVVDALARIEFVGD